MTKSITCLLLIFFIIACGGKSDYINSVEREHVRRNAVFLNPEQSPLDSAEIQQFKGLKFYPADPAYKIEALITWLPQVQYLQMPQTGGDNVQYMLTAVIDFKLFNKAYQLPCYQKAEMKQNHILFIPFTDATNGKETYNGGRYIDLPYTDNRREVVLDFNHAYIPFCAHSARYSCPKVPKENVLPIPIAAGEKL